MAPDLLVMTPSEVLAAVAAVGSGCPAPMTGPH